MILTNSPTSQWPDPPPAAARETQTLWGMDALQLHEQFWASQGIQIVRTGEPAHIDRTALLYFLLDPSLLLLLHPNATLERAAWSQCDLVYLRVHDERQRQFCERVVSDEDGQFLKFERHYDGGPLAKTARILVTPDPKIAAVWQMATEPALAGKALQQVVARNRRMVTSIRGRLYDAVPQSEDEFAIDALRLWQQPERTLKCASKLSTDVWGPPATVIDPTVRIAGSLWIGAGRRIDPHAVVVGPVVLWDDPAARPAPEPVRVVNVARKPTQTGRAIKPAFSRPYCFVKRTFDIIVSLFAVVVSLPLYPIICLAIWLEDGRPFFFAHRRETLGGKKFHCIKFRSMRKDAEKIKRQLLADNDNDIDGPQFFLRNDPRLTRIGAFLRKRQLDELPQFINVLLGQMSIVGPRPSPYAENQFCPPWREARLSVRPGITGLWQVKRTRDANADFQEWIKYDLQYVHSAGLFMDVSIVFQTAMMFIGRLRGNART
jgi:lipopolysaccharide/colanic/teichoic acid biosynthesis glycosyltransferase